MLKAGTETGSLTNHLMSRQGPVTPEVGMGVTVLYWTDRKAGTIIKTTAKTITVQEDTATRIDDNGMSEAQQYEYAPDPDGRITVFRLTKKGWRGPGGGPGLAIGHRDAYHDYSF
jgi:hypothetical protein